MASRLGGTNNCPTSDRHGIQVDPETVRETIAEIERTNGNVFMPTPRDQRASGMPSVELNSDEPPPPPTLEEMLGPSPAELAVIEREAERDQAKQLAKQMRLVM